MVKSNSYLAPDAGERRDEGIDTYAELWRAEKYMQGKHITGDSEKIVWFVRGSSSDVVRWFMKKEHVITTWKMFKREFIKAFGTEDNKEELADCLVQGDMSLGEYTRFISSIYYETREEFGLAEVFSILEGIENGETKKILREQIHKMPKGWCYADWLQEIVRRLERKINACKRIEESKEIERAKKGSSELPGVGSWEEVKREPGPEKGCEAESPKMDDCGKEREKAAKEKAVGEKDGRTEKKERNGRTEKKERNGRTEKKERNGRTEKKERNGRTEKEEAEEDDPPEEGGGIMLENDDIESEEESEVEIVRSEMEVKLLEELKEAYPLVMDNDVRKRPPCGVAICEINTQEGKRANALGKRQVEQALIGRTKEQLAELEKAGVIRKSESPWRSPVRPVEKPDGSVRICVNLIALNDLVIKEEYPTPIMGTLIDKVQGSRWFTIIDLKDGYFQIEIKEEHRHKTAFKFDNLLYEWNRMPMGFKNAPAIFQRIMDRILGDMSGKGVEVYLDDIVIHAVTKEEHDRMVKEVFRRLDKNNMYVNIKKLQLAREEVKLLGMMVDGVKQRMVDGARQDILSYPRPVDVKSLRRFLGKMNFYSPFIKDMSTIAVPLYAKTGKYAKFEWTEEMEKSFQELKKRLAQEVCLYLPDYDKKFTLETDASDTGLGACLQQYDGRGRVVPIRWASRKLTKTEQNYGITEKEFLAVVWGMEYFEHQLKGRRFSLVTDHMALLSIRKKSDFGNKRMARWIDRIQQYDFDITYKKGETMLSADALSRLYEKERKATEVKEDEMSDAGKRTIIWDIHEKLLHRGLGSVQYELEKYYKWPKAKELIEDVIRTCEVCSINNRKQGGGSEFVTTTERLEKTAIDIMKIGESDVFVLVFIDYYTRKMKLKLLESRTTREIIGKLKQIWQELGVPREMNSDNAKEFVAREFLDFCTDYGIRHHLTSVEKHTSNGRVERVIRTVREGIVKTKNLKLSLQETLGRIENAYNNAFHTGIRMTPEEAWNDTGEQLKKMNGPQGDYAKAFKKRRREEFTIGQQVRIANKENLNVKGKSYDRFQERGVIQQYAGNDSYIVRNEAGKRFKVNHSDLKGIEVARV